MLSEAEGLDLPMLYRLSYEASRGAARGNVGSEFAEIFKNIHRKYSPVDLIRRSWV